MGPVGLIVNGAVVFLFGVVLSRFVQPIFSGDWPTILSYGAYIVGGGSVFMGIKRLNIRILLDSIGGGQAEKGAVFGSILGGILGFFLSGYLTNWQINIFYSLMFIGGIGGGAFLGMLLGAAIEIDKRNKRKR